MKSSMQWSPSKLLKWGAWVLVFAALASCENPAAPNDPPVDGWAMVAAGSDHTCGARIDGRVFCWGKNESGQLGDGTTSSSPAPALVTLPSSINVVALEAAGDQTCVLASDGSVYCWGSNLHGELGDGTTNDSSVPVRVQTTASFTSLSMGPHHACALDVSGLASCWGGGISRAGGNLALGFDPPDVCVQSFSYFSDRCSTVPRALPTTLRFAWISAGLFLTCASTSTGAGYCWGWDQYAQLGGGPNGSADSGTLDPQAVVGGLSFESLSAGSLNGCGIDASRAAYCWGSKLGGTPNQFNLGQLGAGDSPNSEGSDTPRRVVGGLSFESLKTNAENNVRALHTCGITTTQEVFCWGANGQSQLGAPAPNICEAISRMMISCTGLPQPVQGSLRASALDTGMFHTCAVGVDREIYCWGKNDDGQLGNDSMVSSPIPVQVQRQ